MNCGCITEIETKLAKHYAGEAGDDAKATLMGKGITFGETLEERLFMPVRIKGSKRPFNTAKGKESNMYFSFCPFCGASAKPVRATPKEG